MLYKTNFKKLFWNKFVKLEIINTVYNPSNIINNTILAPTYNF